MPDTLPDTVSVTAPDTVPDILCLENLRRMTERILDTSNPIGGTKGGKDKGPLEGGHSGPAHSPYYLPRYHSLQVL